MGELKDRIRDDMKQAMKARDTATTGVLRMAVAAINNAEVAGEEARPLSDAEELHIIGKEVASRKDSAEAYTAGSRPELAAKELSEVEVLQRYLPAPLTETELDAIVDDEVTSLRAAEGDLSMKHMGTLVKAVSSRAEGRAEGGTIAAKVRARISS